MRQYGSNFVSRPNKEKEMEISLFLKEKYGVNELFTVDSFIQLTTSLAEAKSSSGDEKGEEKIAATALNAVRMKRIRKQFVPVPELVQCCKGISTGIDWVCLAESWCGDAAQNIPVIAAILEQNPAFSFAVVLRDANPQLMNDFLNNGNKSIPVLIAYEKGTNRYMGKWGSRPKRIQEQALAIKKANPSIVHADFVKEVQLIYARDNGKAMADDLWQMLKDIAPVPVS